MPILITGISLFIVSFIVVLYMLTTINLFKRLVVQLAIQEELINKAITKRYLLFQTFYHILESHLKDGLKPREQNEISGETLTHLSIKEKEAFAKEIEEGLYQVLELLKNHDDIKQSHDVLDLIEKLHEAEDELQTAQRKYNSEVSYYNQKVVIFPSHIIANWQKYEKRLFFEVDAVKI